MPTITQEHERVDDLLDTSAGADRPRRVYDRTEAVMLVAFAGAVIAALMAVVR